jgi:hypothetical protein
VTIDFEGFAPAGGLVNVSPGAPYTEDGFTLTPTNGESAVFDSAAGSDMTGNATDWFGFAESNEPVLTLTGGGASFALWSALIGPSTIGGGTVDMTVTGMLSGGGTVSATFNDLVTATTVLLGWSGLDSVEFTTSDDAGLDDIQIPEPTTLALLGLGLVGVAGLRRRRA